LRDRAASLAPRSTKQRSGDYAQALMDLGATVCTVRKPVCGSCPWSRFCVAKAAGIAEDLPRRAPKQAKPTRKGVAFWAVAPDGAILLRRRPEKGLLGGMMEIPSTEWREAGWTAAAARRAAPVSADWTALPGHVRHTFTHFHLVLEVLATHVEARSADGIWTPPNRFGEHALPTIMKKIVAHAMKVG
jgi:A/G-specific adenine glycosylase